MKPLVLAILGLALGACNQPQQSETETLVMDKGVFEVRRCGESDVECHNERLMQRLAEEHRQQPKSEPEDALGEWKVVAAIEPVGRNYEGEYIMLFEHRDVWLGSRVQIGKTAIIMKPTPNAPVTRAENLSKPGKLYPQCTNPLFDTDLRNSASPMEEYIEPWQDFGLQLPQSGRYVMVSCRGGPEYPDDDSGHVAEVTVEEAEGVSMIYLYSPDLVIVGWGALELLLRRERG